MGDPPTKDACRSCRRPIHWVDGIGWLHGELPQYANQPITCGYAHPVSCTWHRQGECPKGYDVVDQPGGGYPPASTPEETNPHA